tara:strand:- start:52069 stop:53262 length:1194 start_codon:yes stop_codon:yes gene_type:complete
MFGKLPMYQNVGGKAYKKDLKNIFLISEYLNNPHKNIISVHVGGTNGKGSVSHMISSVLQESGYKVGLYTSPHLKDYRERIKINGKEIPKKYVQDFISIHYNFFESNNFSFFEMTVGLAFDYFKNQKVDIAVIEVGMGGRLDSTNIIDPLLSVITNISLDHTKFLGNNIKDIAKEKAGIIKENKTVIIGETHPDTKEVFIQSALEKKSTIIFADQNNHKNYPSDLNGRYQHKNQKTALEALYFLRGKNYKISEVAIENGFNKVIQNTGLRGRWEVLSKNPLIICDTAHNKAALSIVIDQLNDYNSNKIHFILGFTDDKNLEDLSKLFPKDGVFYFVKANIERGAEPNKIMECFARNKRFGETYASINIALDLAKQRTSYKEIIFVGGSSFVVSEIID